MAVETDDRYTRKDWFVCENCQHVNVTNIEKNPKFKKKQRMIWCDDETWHLFKSLAGRFGQDHGGLLRLLCGQLQKERELYDTTA
jgi:hypothetical protein